MSAHRRPYLGALILITLGVLFLLDNLGVADFGTIISTYWPLILILIGIRIFFRYGRSSTQSSPAGIREHRSDTGIECLNGQQLKCIR